MKKKTLLWEGLGLLGTGAIFAFRKILGTLAMFLIERYIIKVFKRIIPGKLIKSLNM